MTPRGCVVLLGGGAVGSLIGGGLAAAGHEVVLVDGWHDHVEAIRADGLLMTTPEGAQRARLQAWHLGDAHRLRNVRPDVAFLTVKLYDTDWAAALLETWLPQSVPVVTMQNALVEERVARIVGHGRTLGGIGSGLDVFMAGPGEVRRTRKRGAAGGTVFKIGEMHGRRTPRAEAIAAMLSDVDTAGVTTDLWTERWVKLTANTMTSGLSGLTGLSLKAVYSGEETRRIAIRLGAEAITLGRAMGFTLERLFGLPGEAWLRAAAGDAEAEAAALDTMAAQAASMVDGGMSGTLQDLSKGRPTEVAFFNGFIATEAARLGLAAPTHARVAALIAEAESGALPLGLGNLALITAGTTAT
ncbi:ketopantoate reductase family protein [Falsiroseomonas sp.]|uniref:ketopantoate reductase family protein n=1 Tax=Falsiroseomonas sp. TaxID=2870721 RepID=UPI002734B0A3|nr:2-dehydropantoate 2-reductase N-terminal domain-containing protein [Falsiroseomonas sp.]MDP3416545.1 ketopantoate reductase C-terminal domain-containing protein [Falsiroseomonas sp.]